MANVFARCLRQQSRSPNTHSHARTHAHTLSYTATPRHHIPPSHSHDRDKGTFSHTGTGTHTQRNTDTQTHPHTSPTRPVYAPRCTRTSQVPGQLTQMHPETQNHLLQTDTRNDADTQRQKHTFTVTHRHSHSLHLDPHRYFHIFYDNYQIHFQHLYTHSHNKLIANKVHTYYDACSLTDEPTMADTQRRSGLWTHPHLHTQSPNTPHV